MTTKHTHFQTTQRRPGAFVVMVACGRRADWMACREASAEVTCERCRKAAELVEMPATARVQ